MVKQIWLIIGMILISLISVNADSDVLNYDLSLLVNETQGITYNSTNNDLTIDYTNVYWDDLFLNNQINYNNLNFLNNLENFSGNLSELYSFKLSLTTQAEKGVGVGLEYFTQLKSYTGYGTYESSVTDQGYFTNALSNPYTFLFDIDNFVGFTMLDGNFIMINNIYVNKSADLITFETLIPEYNLSSINTFTISEKFVNGVNFTLDDISLAIILQNNRVPITITDLSLTTTLPLVEVLGCTNPLANNYNVLATLDDGSCILPEVEEEGILTRTMVDTGNGFAGFFNALFPSVSSWLIVLTILVMVFAIGTIIGKGIQNRFK